jgi:hypothetical protein
LTTTGSEISNTPDGTNSSSTHDSHVSYSSVPTELSSSHSSCVFDKSTYGRDPSN